MSLQRTDGSTVEVEPNEVVVFKKDPNDPSFVLVGDSGGESSDVKSKRATSSAKE